MAKFKNIKIKKPTGGFRLQRVQVLKSGKFKFVKNTAKASMKHRAKPAGKVRKVAKRRKSRKKSQSKSGFLSKVGKPIGSMIYGAIRGRTSDFIANSAIGKKFPVSQVTDEALMLLSMYGLRKFGLAKSGIMRSVVTYGEAIEYARLGETFSDMFMNRNSGAAKAALSF